jgi:hypothetical protein
VASRHEITFARTGVAFDCCNGLLDGARLGMRLTTSRGAANARAHPRSACKVEVARAACAVAVDQTTVLGRVAEVAVAAFAVARTRDELRHAVGSGLRTTAPRVGLADLTVALAWAAHETRRAEATRSAVRVDAAIAAGCAGVRPRSRTRRSTRARCVGRGNGCLWRSGDRCEWTESPISANDALRLAALKGVSSARESMARTVFNMEVRSARVGPNAHNSRDTSVILGDAVRLSPMAKTIGQSLPTLAVAAAAIFVSACQQTGNEAAGSQGPTLSRLEAPQHPDAEPWAFPNSDMAAAPGPCAAFTIQSLAAQIRSRFPAVQSIDTFRMLGPDGPAMDVGPGTLAGEPPPPAVMTDSYFSGLLDAQSVGIVFYQGVTCRGQSCEDQTYWYFETASDCAPRWVGQYHQVLRGTCLDASGSALWNLPATLDPRQLCNADWSPRPIGGVRAATLLGIGMDTCGGTAMNLAPTELAISQSADLQSATVTVSGTGIPALDGRPFVGDVKRERVEIHVTDDLPGPCAATRQFSVTVDFEGSRNFPVAGAFAGIDVMDTVSAGCTRTDATCVASMFLLPRN